MPRCFWYQAASAALSPLLLKNTPPIPVIFATAPSYSLSRLNTCAPLQRPPELEPDHPDAAAERNLAPGYHAPGLCQQQVLFGGAATHLGSRAAVPHAIRQ